MIRRKNLNKNHKRIHKLVKPIFVGSPVRTLSEGGILKNGCDHMAKEQSKGVKSSGIEATKDSIALYSTMNDIIIKGLMNEIKHEKNFFSKSMALNKA